jgi:ABC-type polysaccharide/polyol phosphate export permease
MTQLMGLDYCRRIWRMRHFWLSLVKNDLESRYRRSFLGIGWSLVKPLCMTAVFCTVFAKLFDRNPIDYAPFLLLGLTVWQFLTESMQVGCQCFRMGSGYIKQQRMPLGIFPLRTVLSIGFHQIVALSLAIVLAWLFRGLANPLALLSLIPTLMLYLILGCCLATLFGILHTHFPDTQYLLEVFLQIMFYLTPIMYEIEALREKNRQRLADYLQMNPFHSLLELVRQPVYYGAWPSLQTVQTALVFTAAVGLLAAILLRRVERNLVFWI